MAPKIFYQSSLPRAGSTLLQNILAQNPAFYVTPTSGLIELMLSSRLAYTNNEEFRAQDSAAMKKAFLAFGRAGMEAYFQALSDKPYVVDKSRGWGVHFGLLQMLFGDDPKIICMVRDLRDILASMEKILRRNPDTYKYYENTGNNNCATTAKRVVFNLQGATLGRPLDQLIEVHQRGWANKILFVRFEDLTTRPEAVLQRIYQYLDVPGFSHNFDHVPQVTEEDDAVFRVPDLHKIRTKVEPLPGDALEVIGPDGVGYVQQNFAWYLKLFGYQPISV